MKCGGIAGGKGGSVQEEDEVRLLTPCLAGLGWNELNELEISRLAMMIQNQRRQLGFLQYHDHETEDEFHLFGGLPTGEFWNPNGAGDHDLRK